MKLATPLRVLSVDGKTAVVQTQEGPKKVDISLIENLNSGDYILLHQELAINKLEPEDAKQTIKILSEIRA
jgi:hydrogenase expression/formation protein HypC